jgi:hypothetical protein
MGSIGGEYGGGKARRQYGYETPMTVVHDCIRHCEGLLLDGVCGNKYHPLRTWRSEAEQAEVLTDFMNRG